VSLTGQYNCTFDIERPTTTADAMGGQSKSFAVTYNDVGGMLQPASGRTIEEFARRSMQISHRIYTATEVACRAGDRAIIDSVKYEVVWHEDQAGKGRVYAIYLLRKD
jgi:hypothetical protein